MTVIFDAVQKAGPGGITVGEVNELVFDGRVTASNVRMHFAAINRLLRETSNMQIRGNSPSRGRFCLLREDCRGS